MVQSLFVDLPAVVTGAGGPLYVRIAALAASQVLAAFLSRLVPPQLNELFAAQSIDYKSPAAAWLRTVPGRPIAVDRARSGGRPGRSPEAPAVLYRRNRMRCSRAGRAADPGG